MAYTVKGLGSIFSLELKRLLTIKSSDSKSDKERDYIFFDFDGDPALLARLGLCEDLYIILNHLTLTGSEKDLDRIENSLRPPIVLEGISALNRYRPRKSNLLKFKVVAMAPDTHWRGYRRLDMQKSLEKNISSHFRKWQIEKGNVPLEFWLQQIFKDAYILMRLSDATMRERDYYKEGSSQGLRPTIARALTFLSNPKAEDIVLDPCCGFSNILLERALAAHYQLLIGGDKDSSMVEFSLKRFGDRHKPWRLEQWDAKMIPLEDKSVDVILTQPPRPRKEAKAEQLISFYNALFGEYCRLLKGGGRLVLLSSSRLAIQEVIKNYPNLILINRIKGLTLMHRESDIFVFYLTA